MRLKSVSINGYKNLQEFKLNFDGDSFLDVFVGKNGSGKSNLFEALIEIFRHLHASRKSMAACPFDYSIAYMVEDETIFVEWESGNLRVNRKDRKTSDAIRLPDNILIYYSGHNDTVHALVRKYEDDFGKDVKDVSMEESRLFIGVGAEYKALLLAVLLLQAKENPARRYICEKLGIAAMGETFTLTLKRPRFADSRLMEILETKKRSEAKIDAYDSRTQFWGALGIVRIFLEQLVTCIKGSFQPSDIYDSSKDQYELKLSTELFLSKQSSPNAIDQFKAFDNLRTVGMLGDIELPVSLTNGTEGGLHSFSDGQFQSAYIYAIAEIFKEAECLTILDEPDAFLHPEWQFEYLKQAFDLNQEATAKNHVLLSTHSAATLCPLDAQQIRLFTAGDTGVSCVRRAKKEIIRELSDSAIQYSEDESKLLIDNAIRRSSHPVLFVEGVTDVAILNTAYRKLYGVEDVPLLVQDVFDRGTLMGIMARNEIYDNYPDKVFFGLFDFDDAYENWRELKGKEEDGGIDVGLRKRLKDGRGYALLLPVPNNELREQVWDETRSTEHVIPTRLFCVEHAFWGIPSLNDWFRQCPDTGVVEFKGNSKRKVKFAEEIVPKLDAEQFEIFRPMFEFIAAKSGAGIVM